MIHEITEIHEQETDGNPSFDRVSAVGEIKHRGKVRVSGKVDTQANVDMPPPVLYLLT